MESEKTDNLPIKKKNGGARPGSGSKLGAKYKKTIAKQTATMYLIRKIEENIEPLTRALIEKALTGETPALKEAFERGLGKVKEMRDVTVTISSVKDLPNEQLETYAEGSIS